MICQDSRAPSISIELEILWGGGWEGGGGPDPLHGKSQVQWKNLELWNLGKIIVSLPILLHPLAYLPIDTLIQEFIEFICVSIDFIR